MDIKKLINEIIPPRDYQNRNGFNNNSLIDNLTKDEKDIVEDALIHKLLFESEQETDTLIVETLAYLKSQKSVPVLIDLLYKSKDEIVKIIIAGSIFQINQEYTMIDVAISSFNELKKDNGPYYVYNLSTTFYYLAKFKNSDINQIIKTYITDEKYLISYNAKRALNL